MKAKIILIYSLGAFAFFVVAPCIMIVLSKIFPAQFLPNVSYIPILGAVSSAFGIILCIWSNHSLYVHGHGFAPVIGKIKLLKESDTLVTTGAYGVCRNPMHTGIILFYLGLSCAINSLASLIIPLLMFIFAYIFAVFIDEPRLRRDFGEDFEVYTQNVPRFMPKLRK